jgi:hypothetical protein
MLDLSMTSGIGLMLVPECRCRIDTVDYRKNADAAQFFSLRYRFRRSRI